MRSSRTRRTAGLTAALVVGLGLFVSAAPARAGECAYEPIDEATLVAYEADVLALVNDEREAQGLVRVSSREDLRTDARTHARRMVEEGQISHDPQMQADRYGAHASGEVVGRGWCSPERVVASLMGSPGHRATMMDEAWTQGAFGLASTDQGTLYYVGAFLQPAPSPVAQPAVPAAQRTVKAATVQAASGRPAPVPVAVQSVIADPVPETQVAGERLVALGEATFERVDVPSQPAAPADAAADRTFTGGLALLVSALAFTVFGSPMRRERVR